MGLSISGKNLGKVSLLYLVFVICFLFTCLMRELLFSDTSASLDKLYEAYEAGMSTGDVEYAIVNLFHYTTHAIFGTGGNLKTLSAKIQ